MELFKLFGNIYFGNLEDVIEFLASSAPMWLLTVFAVNCLFSIFNDISSLGGKR